MGLRPLANRLAGWTNAGVPPPTLIPVYTLMSNDCILGYRIACTLNHETLQLSVVLQKQDAEKKLM